MCESWTPHLRGGETRAQTKQILEILKKRRCILKQGIARNYFTTSHKFLMNLSPLQFRWLFVGLFASSVCFGILVRADQPTEKQTPSVEQQESDAPVTEWTTSMPVSMNGQLPKKSTFWRPGTEAERWHSLYPTAGYTYFIRKNFRAKEYFKDPQVIELCDAIFALDIPELRRLIANGVDVNSVGKNGMTPLAWAFLVDTDPRPFGLLLSHGADPNVVFAEPNTGWESATVTHLVAFGVYNRQFKNVFENGGDPNLLQKFGTYTEPQSVTPFMLVFDECPDAIERLQLLIDKGAKLDLRTEDGSTFLSKKAPKAIRSDIQSRMMLKVLDAGANYELFYKQTSNQREPHPFEGCYFRLIHILALAELELDGELPGTPVHYRELIAWLEERGESLDDARNDLERWEQLVLQGRADEIEKEHQQRLSHQPRQPK